MKPSFKPHIYIDKNKFELISIDKNKKFHGKNKFAKVKIKTLMLKARIKFILAILCDFSSEVSVRFCDTAEMVQANTSFRKKHYPTDVLSFPNAVSYNEDNNLYLGDILICIPVCILQAQLAKINFSEELDKMIIHGILHLKGFDHERSASDWRIMNILENSLQKELNKFLKKPTWCSVVVQ